MYLSRFSSKTQLSAVYHENPIIIIVKAILQRGLGATYNTLPANVLEWCSTIVELPHHEGGLSITSLPASGMAAF
jgi:hypothetical protein